MATIPTLAAPGRRSQKHYIELTPGSSHATIHSDPVEVELVNGVDLPEQPFRLGAQYDNFEKFWSYAKLLGRNSVAAALPSRT